MFDVHSLCSSLFRKVVQFSELHFFKQSHMPPALFHAQWHRSRWLIHRIVITSDCGTSVGKIWYGYSRYCVTAPSLRITTTTTTQQRRQQQQRQQRRRRRRRRRQQQQQQPRRRRRRRHLKRRNLHYDVADIRHLLRHQATSDNDDDDDAVDCELYCTGYVTHPSSSSSSLSSSFVVDDVVRCSSLVGHEPRATTTHFTSSGS